jgi:hypothetical protein
MKALSPIHILRVPRQGSHFFASPLDSYCFAVTNFCTPAVRWCNVALGRGKPRRRFFPSLNLHNIRIRRKPGGHVLTD